MLDIETVTPEMARAWIDSGVHPRYYKTGMFRDPWAVESYVLKLKQGCRLLVTLSTESREVLDGALGLHGLIRFGEPVECAVLRVPSFEEYSTRQWGRLPYGWAFLKMAPEHRPSFARSLPSESL